MEYFGNLRIRKNYNNFILKYETLYFVINQKEYNILKYLYNNRFNINILVQYNKTQIHNLLYYTGNIPRNGIYISTEYKDCIFINKNAKITAENILFFLNFFNTNETYICKQNTILDLVTKQEVYSRLFKLKLQSNLRIIRVNSCLGEKIRRNNYDFERNYCIK